MLTKSRRTETTWRACPSVMNQKYSECMKTPTLHFRWANNSACIRTPLCWCINIQYCTSLIPRPHAHPSGLGTRLVLCQRFTLVDTVNLLDINIILYFNISHLFISHHYIIPVYIFISPVVCFMLLLTKVYMTKTFNRIKFWCYVKLNNSTIIISYIDLTV